MSTELITAPAEPARFRCRHIFTDGRRCASPALRTQDFCYYHHTVRSPIPRRELLRRRQFADVADGELTARHAPAFTLPTTADLTERSGIQHTIGLILSRIAANDLDPRRAGLLLYGLQIASMNLPRREPESDPIETVEDLTDDPIHGPIAPPAEFIPRRRFSCPSLFPDDPEHDDSEHDEADRNDEEYDDEEHEDDENDEDDDENDANDEEYDE